MIFYLPLRSLKVSTLLIFSKELFNPSIFSREEALRIKSGIKVNVPQGYALIAFNKSGISTKLGLIVGACVIDSGYQGELSIHIINTSSILNI